MITRTIAAGVLALAAMSAVPAQADMAPVSQATMHADYRGHEFPGREGGRHGWNQRRPGGMNWRWQRHDMSAVQIHWSLRQQGFRDIRGISRRGPVYQAWAIDFRGAPVRVVVSARSGAVLNVRHARG